MEGMEEQLRNAEKWEQSALEAMGEQLKDAERCEEELMTKMKEDHETRAAIRITQTEIGLEKVRLQDAVDAAEKAAQRAASDAEMMKEQHDVDWKQWEVEKLMLEEECDALRGKCRELTAAAEELEGERGEQLQAGAKEQLARHVELRVAAVGRTTTRRGGRGGRLRRGRAPV